MVIFNRESHKGSGASTRAYRIPGPPKKRCQAHPEWGEVPERKNCNTFKTLKKIQVKGQEY